MKTTTNLQLLLYFIVVILSITSCAELKLSNTSTGKYKYEKDSPKANNVLEVNVGILPIISSNPPDYKPKTFWDLRDSIPHLYLRLLSEKTSNADTLIKLISKPLDTPEKKTTTAKADFQDIKVMFVFSNIKKYYEDKDFMHSNTRLEILNTSLEIKNNDAVYFYSIDKLENEFEEIDLGTIDRTQEVKFQTNISAETGMGISSNNIYGYDQNSSNGTDDGNGNISNNSTNKSKKNTTTSEAKSGYKADASYANNEAIKEMINSKLKRMKTGFSFSSKKITVSQRGGANRDISDNVYVTATLRLKNKTNKNSVDSKYITKFTNLYDARNRQVIADKIEFQQQNMNYIMCDGLEDIYFKTSFAGAIRSVDNRNHNNSYLEFDDKVTFYRISGETENEKLTLEKATFCKNVYRIKTTIKNHEGLFYLYISNKKDYVGEVLLSEETKNGLLNWLLDALNNPTLELLRTDNFELFFENESRKRIYIAGKDIVESNFGEFENIAPIFDVVTSKN